MEECEAIEIGVLIYCKNQDQKKKKRVKSHNSTVFSFTNNSRDWKSYVGLCLWVDHSQGNLVVAFVNISWRYTKKAETWNSPILGTLMKLY